MNLSPKTTYILLRDNKESGPFSLDTLKEMGLRSTDLLWVEGQSVYWMAPDQIPELKIQVEIKGEKQVSEHEAYQPAIVNAAPYTDDIWKDYIPQNEKEVIGNKGQHAVKTQADVKEMYAKEPEPRKLRLQNELRLPIPPGLKKMLPYIALFIVGIVGGILISGNKKKRTSSAQTNSATAPAKNADSTSQAAITTNTVADTLIVFAPVQEEITPVKTIPTNEKILKDDPLTTEAKDKTTEKNPVVTAEKDPNEKIKDPVEEKPKPKENIASKVSVKTNDYIVASFGGIRNLELTVDNDSKYTLDKVVVEIQYLKPRDELLKTETVQFYLVPPGGKQTLAVKKSNRGIKVTCRVIKVESKEID